MTLALALSVLVGVALGLLGGGGSILTVPILVYGVGLETRPAIATSLVVVGVTSLAALAQRARSGLVDYRTGAVFGAAGMAGAYAGGRVASFVPEWMLLVGFAGMMLATAIAMLRRRDDACDDDAAATGARALPLGRTVAHGVGVGAVTGLVGAGGGFLTVPALALLGGMSMRRAVATSLLVISMKSFAGLAGYLGHVAIDWQLAGLVGVAAIGGSFVGSALAKKVPQRALRQAFGWFVVAMAVFMVGEQLGPAVTASPAYQAVFVDRWPFWVAGLVISSVVFLLLFSTGKLLGVSTGCGELCALPNDPAARRSWRPRFLFGILLGGIAGAVLSGAHPRFDVATLDAILGAPWAKVPLLLASGLLIGWGARTAGGCTSGHGIVGTALGARSSLLATALFMVGGFAATGALVALGGR